MLSKPTVASDRAKYQSRQGAFAQIRARTAAPMRSAPPVVSREAKRRSRAPAVGVAVSEVRAFSCPVVGSFCRPALQPVPPTRLPGSPAGQPSVRRAVPGASVRQVVSRAISTNRVRVFQFRAVVQVPAARSIAAGVSLDRPMPFT